jgi:GTP-binding protein
VRKELQVVIVGRPNVGKSTFFNRLIGRRRALVHDEPGVTRDRLELDWEIKRKNQLLRVRLVDTGGLGGERFQDEIDAQVRMALSRADLILFLLDRQAGVLPQDRELLRAFQNQGVFEHIPCVLVINKVDSPKHEDDLGEFYELGQEFLPISAEHDRGTQDVIDRIWTEGRSLGRLETLQEEEDEAEGSDAESSLLPGRLPRLAIVGRPNVGKSTLLNALVGQERMIVSPIAGTTVDSIDTVCELDGHQWVLVDTAGIRRKSRTEQGIEVLSVVQSRKTIEAADVVVLVLDGESGISEQDEKIGGLIEEAGRGVILFMNKWDVHRGSDFTKDDAAERIRKQIKFLSYAPLLFGSAKYGRGIEGLGKLAFEILEQRRIHVPTHEFTEWVREKSKIHNPNNVKFFLSHQNGKNPPRFTCHVSDPERIHFSLKRHLVRGIRERWGFMGSPVVLHFTKGKAKASRPNPHGKRSPRRHLDRKKP